MLNKPIRLHKLAKLLPRDKVIFTAVLLAGARAAGRVRDAEAVAVGVLGEEALEEGGLAGARGAGDDDGAVFCEWSEVVSGGWRVRVGGMEGFRGAFIYLPVEDIVARWRVGMEETGVARRMLVEEFLKAFVKQ